MPILIVGLGNPGDEYTRTRHNAGFLAIDSLAEALQEKWKLDKPAQAEVIETQYFNTKIILAKPHTFMNLSGKSVASLAHRFQIPLKISGLSPMTSPYHLVPSEFVAMVAPEATTVSNRSSKV